MFEYASQGKIRLFSVIAALFLSCSVAAQVRVVEAGADNNAAPPSQNTQNNSASAPASAAAAGGNRNDNDIVITLYNMLESLQQEVQMLRGMVEEQGYQIRRMETEQRDRYLDVDNRLSVINQRLNQGGGAINTLPGNTALPNTANTPSLQGNTPNTLPANNLPANTAANNRPANPLPQQNTPVLPNPGDTQATVGASTPLALNQQATEEELYQEARNLLLNDADYEASVSVFQQMIERYPNGRLAPNAYYWQGEALILVERFSQAINVFNAVINNFPNHEKAPDSMLKLGIVYSLMNNERRAQEVWRDLLSRYANSGSGSLRLAEVYLRDGYNR